MDKGDSVRKAVVAGVVASIAMMGTFSVAGAEPPGLGKFGGEWVCDGETTTIFVRSRNGWVGDTLYHAVSVSVEGIFTPTGGEPQPVSFFKEWGNGRGADSPEAITCIQQLNDILPDGTFVGQQTAVAVPVH